MSSSSVSVPETGRRSGDNDSALLCSFRRETCTRAVSHQSGSGDRLLSSALRRALAMGGAGASSGIFSLLLPVARYRESERERERGRIACVSVSVP